MFKNIKNRILYLLALPYIFFILILITLLRPFIQLRFYEIRSNRIGHFTLQVELYLIRKKLKKNNRKIIDIFCTQSMISNIFFYNKINKIIKIFPRIIIFPIIKLLKIMNLNSYLVPEKEFFQKDLNNLIDKTKSTIIFSDEENEMGKKILKKIGIGDSEKYVCINTRDDYYTKKNFKINLDYHKYRNVDIEEFKIISEYLVSRQFKVVRIGKDVNKPISFSSSDIIDYASSNLRSDFIDFFLIKNCYFYIGAGGGLDAVPIVLRKPKLSTNLVPIVGITSEIRNVMTIFKHHYSKVLNRRLTLTEIVKYKYFNIYKDEIYKREGIILENNSQDEIIDAIKDLINLIENRLKLSIRDRLNQKEFWDKFPLDTLDSDGNTLHGKKINSLISPSFLKRNQYLLHN